MKQKSLHFIKFVICNIFLFALSTTSVFAVKTLGDAQGNSSQIAKSGGFEQSNVAELLGNVIKKGLTVVGVVFFALMIYAGLRWMTARGESEQVEKARGTIIASMIGLVIIVSSYAITNFVQINIIQKSGGGGVDGPNAPNVAGGEKIACCLDWTGGTADKSTAIASRMTTLNDCKYQGENSNGSDNFGCAGPKAGCWEYFAEVATLDQCAIKKQEAYNTTGVTPPVNSWKDIFQ